MDDLGIGARVARARKLARLTQLQLAQKANVSVSLLRKVEQGDRPATPAFVAAVARAIGVSIGELNGQPYTASRSDAAAHALIPELRRAIVAFNDEPPSVPMNFEEMKAALDRVREGMRRARYSDMISELPDVLLGLHQLAEAESPGRHLEDIYSTMAYAYSKAMLFAYQYGYLDLAGLAAERCAWAGDRSGDPIWPLAAQYNKALIMLYSGAYAGGLRTIERAYTASEHIPTSPDLLAVRGALHLRGSILSARAADHDTAESHLSGARDIAGAIGSARFNHYGTGFRPSNVDIHSVAVPVELSDGTTAVSRAERIQLPPSVAPSRAGHHFIDVSRAWLLHGDKERSLQSLQDARRIAPELTRNHPQVHETVRVLARTRRSTDPLASFAKWADIKI
ncbi:helix-turn-helix transcriptional regulator [Nocardia terpenica]|uniref:helix-turn-helix domain-containing protein n=1 Tax=Nocardia terpenica TaxID=455432 RepID=UPI001894A58B|nr:helix-turn-helix transcriptional regulator [Nocardia terpenica]MBF6061240.1 helix-turn-helix transcriptional regulator [Nocardia terpenica]MBF6105531.1 helix-turn-helix transcriptional regulator [Nocardia terpenica]MBF6112999.1 helix-turn-helix transcriptional regulator [Nocardia terpenica]MBF6119129.1 helix-turn-helix transcriptional regulator [Nocardia terpenica]MBF6152777.1 helix-turn-helix transcriptional regulator [Nocardia terpenica]